MRKSSHWIVAIIVVTTVTMILWRTEFSATLRLPNDASLRALEISGALLAVAVFVERSLAVILDLIFVDRKSDPRVGLITSESLSAEFGEILRVQSRKQRIRIIAGFAISVLISLAGLRTLQNLLSGEPSSWTQKLLLQVVDVLLTAGLLAGGSAGIAATIDFLKNRGLTNSLKHLAEVRAFTNLARSSEEKGKSA